MGPMIDFDTKNLVIVCYPPLAGGKFLISSLGLSDSCVLQDQALAKQQLQNNLSFDAKINYINQELTKAKSTLTWCDLNLGCGQLFGVENDHYVNEYPEIFKHRYYDVVGQLSNSDYRFFKVAHNSLYLQAQIKIWPNARVIVFQNYQNFIRRRALPRDRSLAHKLFDDGIAATLSGLPMDQYYFWDTSCYDELKSFQFEFTRCASWLGIKPVDIDQLSCYYNNWRDTIDFIKANK